MTTFGRVTVEGTPEQVALVQQALAEVVKGAPLESLLVHEFRIVFRPANEMPFVPGTTTRAWGYVVGPRKLAINANLAAKRPARAKYTIRHELVHGLQGDRLTAAKKTLILPLLRRRDGTTLTAWRQGAYPDRPSEIVADGLAAWMADSESPLADYYGDLVDPQRAYDVLVAPDPSPVEPEPELPEPIPGPDEQLVKAKARIVQLEIALYEIALKATSVKKEDVT